MIFHYFFFKKKIKILKSIDLRSIHKGINSISTQNIMQMNIKIVADIFTYKTQKHMINP
jgi:hypothetical protein